MLLEFTPLLAWVDLALWSISLASYFPNRRDRFSAALNAIVALPFLAASLATPAGWANDPSAYAVIYGAAALSEPPGWGILLIFARASLMACCLAYRGGRQCIVHGPAINGAGIVGPIHSTKYSNDPQRRPRQPSFAPRADQNFSKAYRSAPLHLAPFRGLLGARPMSPGHALRRR